ncbi:FecCD family ABC transporter permease [Ruminiclostridium cellobioparum]|uniref:ABC-type Fe3+-siderophore transport system, permease component n=1 Tax=Ruminiclostridium cellobioparum subsp. termitidis CT1112 TaxID=1195236 RepID=S0FL34_RUMCE|nr:iron ABC transporter permease [Ruminiclostridium cellobioparum]EMS72602.1 ABC-type Fe3+-siderophore transport system, permease component [Ruminiclostridium cellobioparum subsp. termitidis CT1112]
MKSSKIIALLVCSMFILLVCILASLAFGARFVNFPDVIDILIHSKKTSLIDIVVHERIPRTVFGIIAGAALGVSGALMQAITRNPIADPSILGVNTGASLFVVSGMAFLHIGSFSQYIWLALMGAAVTSLFVYGIGSLGYGGATPIKLALAGAATSAALSSVVSAVILPRTEVMNAFRFWQVGSISGATWEGIYTILPFLIVGMLMGLLVSPALDALALGDDVATGLGVRTGTIRLIGALSGVLLCGATTALAGPIGFVGLMVPHTMRLICGPNLRLVIPMSAVGGAILLTISDVLGRLIGSPGELESGIVTSFLGAPILIIIAMRAKVRTL